MFSHFLISDRLSTSQHPKLSSQNAVELFCEVRSHVPDSGMSPPGRASVTVSGAPREAGSREDRDWLCRSEMTPGDTPTEQARGGLGSCGSLLCCPPAFQDVLGVAKNTRPAER